MRLNLFLVFLITAAIGFFSLQFVQHSGVSLGLLGGLMMLGYVLAFFVLYVATVLCVGKWLAESDGTSRVRRRAWAVTFVLMAAIGTGLTLGSHAYARGLPLGSFSERFDARVWRDSDSDFGGGGLSDRQKMLGGVLKDVVQDGTRESIRKQLGMPELFSAAGAYASEQKLIYRLGPDRGGFGIDSEWLTIHLDQAGKMMQYEIWED